MVIFQSYLMENFQYHWKYISKDFLDRRGYLRLWHLEDIYSIAMTVEASFVVFVIKILLLEVLLMRNEWMNEWMQCWRNKLVIAFPPLPFLSFPFSRCSWCNRIWQWMNHFDSILKLLMYPLPVDMIASSLSALQAPRRLPLLHLLRYYDIRIYEYSSLSIRWDDCTSNS